MQVRSVERLLRQIVQHAQRPHGGDRAMLPVCAPQILRVLQDLGDQPKVSYLCFYALARVCWVDEATKDFL